MGRLGKLGRLGRSNRTAPGQEGSKCSQARPYRRASLVPAPTLTTAVRCRGLSRSTRPMQLLLQSFPRWSFASPQEKALSCSRRCCLGSGQIRPYLGPSTSPPNGQALQKTPLGSLSLEPGWPEWDVRTAFIRGPKGKSSCCPEQSRLARPKMAQRTKVSGAAPSQDTQKSKIIDEVGDWRTIGEDNASGGDNCQARVMAGRAVRDACLSVCAALGCSSSLAPFCTLFGCR